ncbi:MAG: RNA methyltransferase, partial [Rhodothermales bacterium]|nr:RNA methyltransferase [Rhodothermales bacterium]
HVVIRGESFAPEKIVELLSPFISDDRAARIHEVVGQRSRSIVTVVEGVVNYGNASAVMRTAEALGFFEFHVIAGDQPYKQSRRTSQGAEKWLDLRVWDDTAGCIRALKDRGYRIAVTESGPDAVSVSELDFTQATAIVFGNEVEGVSKELRESADVTCRVDMQGFVESFNISVAAALVLYQAFQDRTGRLGRNGDLSSPERRSLEAHYLIRAVQNAEAIVLESHRRTAADH